MIDIDLMDESQRVVVRGLIASHHLIKGDPYRLVTIHAATLAVILATTVGLTVPIMKDAGREVPEFDPEDASPDQVAQALASYGIESLNVQVADE